MHANGSNAVVQKFSAQQDNTFYIAIGVLVFHHKPHAFIVIYSYVFPVLVQIAEASYIATYSYSLLNAIK